MATANDDTRTYWVSGLGSEKITFVPLEKKQKAEKQMKSGNHFQAKKSENGEWTCDTCGGESMDFELFEEFGDINGCFALGMGKDGKGGNPKTLLDHADVQRARQHIEDMKNAMEKAGAEAIAATSAVDSLGRTILRAGDGTEIGYWEEGEEIEEKAADGSVAVVYKKPDRFVSTVDTSVASVLPGVPVSRGGITYGYDSTSSVADYAGASSDRMDAVTSAVKELNKPVYISATHDPAASRMQIKKGSWLDKALRRGQA